MKSRSLRSFAMPLFASSQSLCRITVRGSLLIIAAAAISATLGCSGPQATLPQAGPPKVAVVAAGSQKTIDYDEFIGRTEAVETVEVRSRVSGFIRSVEFTDGAFVDEGALLFQIEPDAYQAIHQQSLSRIDLWRAKLNLAEKKFDRAKALIQTGAITPDEFEEYKAAVEEAQAQITAAQADAKRSELDVNYTKVTAPISGRIDRAFVTKGNVVSGGLGTGTMLTRIVRNDPIYTYVDVDERSMLRYQRKQAAAAEGKPQDATLKSLQVPCEMQLGDEKDYPHVGVLDFAENRIDAETGTIRIRAVFDNKNRLLTGGMFVRVRIPVSEEYDAVLIPEEAIGDDQGRKFAYVVEAGKAIRRNLVIGAQRDRMRIVKEGIAAGDKVIARGIQRVRPGLEVQVVEQ
ncbi:MAG: efflux RND transporter periplasmic adaptor subunit [Pirellulales bacterium]